MSNTQDIHVVARVFACPAGGRGPEAIPTYPLDGSKSVPPLPPLGDVGVPKHTCSPNADDGEMRIVPRVELA